MQIRTTTTVEFDLGGVGLITPTPPTLTSSASFSSGEDSLVVSMEAAKFASLELEIYGTETIPQYPAISLEYGMTLPFSLGNTANIFAGTLAIQHPGTIEQTGDYTDSLDITVADANGDVIFVVPEVYYSAANIEGSTASTPDILISYIPILEGAEIINPAGMQTITQSYGDYNLSSDFVFEVYNSQGSTFGTAPTITADSASLELNATVIFDISLGAVNDGMSIFGTYAAPKTYTYPDGSTIPSQKQIWTL